MRLAVVGVVFLVSVGALVGFGLRASNIPVYEFSALTAAESTYQGGALQLDGVKVVAVESMHPLQFTVAPDGGNVTPIRVSSRLSPPENFGVGKSVSLRGTYSRPDRAFEAVMITTKCPSRYEASKEAEAADGASPAARGPTGLTSS